MAESQVSLRGSRPKPKKVSIQERSVLVGDIIIVNSYRVDRAALKHRFAEGGYHLQETAHFWLFTRSEAPTTILVHGFASEEVNADIKHYVALELKPLGLLMEPRRYGDILTGVVGSFFPEDVRRAWRYFGANTLQRPAQKAPVDLRRG